MNKSPDLDMTHARLCFYAALVLVGAAVVAFVVCSAVGCLAG